MAAAPGGAYAPGGPGHQFELCSLRSFGVCARSRWYCRGATLLACARRFAFGLVLLSELTRCGAFVDPLWEVQLLLIARCFIRTLRALACVDHTLSEHFLFGGGGTTRLSFPSLFKPREVSRWRNTEWQELHRNKKAFAIRSRGLGHRLSRVPLVAYIWSGRSLHPGVAYTRTGAFRLGRVALSARPGVCLRMIVFE